MQYVKLNLFKIIDCYKAFINCKCSNILKTMNKIYLLLLPLICFTWVGYSQSGTIEKPISIELDSVEFTPNNWPVFNQLTEIESIAYYQDLSTINSRVTTNFEIIDEVWEDIPFNINNEEVDESNRFIHKAEVAGRNTTAIRTFIHPFRKNGFNWEYLKSCTLIIYYDELPPEPRAEVLESGLSQGQNFQFSIEETGFYKIGYDEINRLNGVDASTLKPSDVHIYGYRGGNLPEAIQSKEFDQLPEVPLHFEGDDDNLFESGEYFVLFAYGPDRWETSEGTFGYRYNKNVYEKKNVYTINISNRERRLLELETFAGTAEFSSSQFDALIHYEKDERNLLYDSPSHYGSGKQWFGEIFNNSPAQSLLSISMDNYVNGSEVHARLRMAVRAGQRTSFELLEGGSSLASKNASSISLTSSTSSYADVEILDHNWIPSNEVLELGVNYPSSNGTAWLDYIGFRYPSSLVYRKNIQGGFLFSDLRSASYPNISFNLENLPNMALALCLDTEFYYSEIPLEGSTLKHANSFTTHFYAIADLENLPAIPEAEAIDNQDILSNTDLDLLILYHPQFEEQVMRLAEHRRTFNGLKVETVEIQKVYNEFSGGRVDVSAIRDYSRYLYNTSSNYNYLLLFGGGTFDVRNIYNQSEKLAYIPTYETNNSVSPLRAYPSDDYFGLLNDNEGGDIGSGSVDIGIGRLPVNTVNQARIVVDKLIKYDADPSVFGDWKTYITFMADDEDSNLHFRDADDVARASTLTYGELNVDKIYFDAFEQISTSGGPRYPDAKKALTNQLAEGRLAICYLGHGSYRGLSQERVIVADDISNWGNRNKYPLFITATCSFSAFDDPSFYSAGEQTFLKENGGSIGLFTTTRLVYASGNKHLTDDVFGSIFKRDNTGMPLRLGDVIRLAKNENIGNNTRKFAFLGDPSMRIALPLYKVETTKINDFDIIESRIDTLSALEEIKLEGEIKDYNDNLLSDFNGELTVTLFDKEKTLKTLGNDSKSYPESFNLRNTVLFKGRTEVKNGKWSIRFILPQDINFTIGEGKVSYYAHDGMHTDAWGMYQNVYVGGINQNAELDQTPPIVDVYMNNADFRFGGITDQSPDLYVELFDDQGINISSSGLGHTPYALLDEGVERFQLERFYKTNLNSSSSGTITYPLENLEPGLHRIDVKVWDIQNNSGTGYTEFLVVSSEKELIEELINYPNPFAHQTNFAFEHTLNGIEADIFIDIFSSSGQLVRTLELRSEVLEGYRKEGINWDGNSGNGQALSNGIYFYKVKIIPLDKSGKTFESKAKKLIMVR